MISRTKRDGQLGRPFSRGIRPAFLDMLTGGLEIEGRPYAAAGSLFAVSSTIWSIAFRTTLLRRLNNGLSSPVPDRSRPGIDEEIAS